MMSENISIVAAILAAAVIQRPDFDLTGDPAKKALDLYHQISQEEYQRTKQRS
jgi:hypothetical protein